MLETIVHHAQEHTAFHKKSLKVWAWQSITRAGLTAIGHPNLIFLPQMGTTQLPGRKESDAALCRDDPPPTILLFHSSLLGLLGHCTPLQRYGYFSLANELLDQTTHANLYQSSVTQQWPERIMQSFVKVGYYKAI